MRIAQQLYEGVNIKGQGTVGLITYLRTYSTRISLEADAAAKEYIKEAYGAEFVGAGTVAKKDDKKVQDANEAIRPTYMTNSPASIKDELSRDQFRLYLSLIHISGTWSILRTCLLRSDPEHS